MSHWGAFRPEYSRFILALVLQRPLTRQFYLVVFAIVVAVLAGTGLYLRYRALKAAEAAANCDTPAPPPKPAAPPPKLPGFELEAGCGAAPAKPAK